MKRLVIKLIHFYQRDISSHLPPRCRFYPTCSSYMITAIKRFGVFEGAIMGIARIIRCNPFNRGGYDPVPYHFSIFRNRFPE